MRTQRPRQIQHARSTRHLSPTPQPVRRSRATSTRGRSNSPGRHSMLRSAQCSGAEFEHCAGAGWGGDFDGAPLAWSMSWPCQARKQEAISLRLSSYAPSQPAAPANVRPGRRTEFGDRRDRNGIAHTGRDRWRLHRGPSSGADFAPPCDPIDALGDPPSDSTGLRSLARRICTHFDAPPCEFVGTEEPREGRSHSPSELESRLMSRVAVTVNRITRRPCGHRRHPLFRATRQQSPGHVHLAL